MSDIQLELAALANSRVTPAVLGALDYLVPGEWQNVTSLEDTVRVNLGVTDPAQVAAIVERSRALWQARPHYQRALSIYRAVDTADKAAAAAVAANAVGNTFSFLGFLNKLTPKPDTTQALDAALKLAAEVAAFATLRGLPTSSLAEAAAFPAALATYAKADMMRLAAWVAIDGILPLGPQFISKVVGVVQSVDSTLLAANPLFGAVKGYIPGGDIMAQKGFIIGSLNAGANYVNEFVAARGISQDMVAGKLGSLVTVADKSMDALAAALDATTDYYSHTGLQSVARVLVHDAQESLAAGEVVAPATAEAAPTAEGSSWFRTAAIGTGVVAAVGAAGVAAAGVAGAAALWNAWSSDDDKDDENDQADDPAVDAELASLDDNALAAREQAIEMQARQVFAQAGNGAPTPQQQEQLMRLRQMRRRLRRMRRIRMRMAMRAGRPGLGRMGMGMGRGGGGGGRGGGMGRGGRGRF